MILIDIQDDGAQRLTDFLGMIQGIPEADELKALVGNDVAELIRQHLYARDAQPNALGGKKTHFYRQAGDSVTHEPWAQGVFVSVAQEGIRQRVEGGDIVPKTKRALTIPLVAAAHGKRAGEFPDLFLIAADDGDPDTAGYLGRTVGDGQVQALYVLRTRVHQEADPTVMPTDEQINATAIKAIQEYADAIFNAQCTMNASTPKPCRPLCIAHFAR